MNIALTGITGMVGSHLVRRLDKENPDGGKYKIRALIRESSVVEHLKPYEDIDYIIGDLTDKDSLSKLVADADTVIHLAHFPGPVQSADELVKANVNGSYELLEAAKKAKVKQFIFISACAVFGDVLPTVSAESPMDENHPVRPTGLYGAIKSSIEAFCFSYHKARAFDLTIFRPVTVYGVKPDIDKSEWFKTVDFLATNYNVDLKGSTKYVSVDSVCQAISKVIGKSDAKPIYHLIDGHIHNLDLGELIAEIVDSFGEAQGVRGQEGVPMSSDAAKELGVEFKGLDGIKEYIKLIHQLQVQYGGERSVDSW